MIYAFLGRLADQFLCSVGLLCARQQKAEGLKRALRVSNLQPPASSLMGWVVLRARDRPSLPPLTKMER